MPRFSLLLVVLLSLGLTPSCSRLPAWQLVYVTQVEQSAFPEGIEDLLPAPGESLAVGESWKDHHSVVAKESIDLKAWNLVLAHGYELDLAESSTASLKTKSSGPPTKGTFYVYKYPAAYRNKMAVCTFSTIQQSTP